MKTTKILLVLIVLCGLSLKGQTEIIPDYFDVNGNPMHSADEFNVNVSVVVQKVAKGYSYDYTVRSLSTSIQSIGGFSVVLKADAIIPNSSSTPAYIKLKREPHLNDKLPVMAWAISFDKLSPNVIVPGGVARGFSFTSPFPPSIVEAYLQGLTEDPLFNPLYPDGHPLYSGRTKYGPGKIMPVIGPVKPTTPNVTDNYSVIGCAGGICDVQLDIAGPQDPYGTNYTYLWSGAFGTATGAKPVVQLAAGTYNVSVSVSDPYATLVTATIPVTVIDPNPPVITPPAGNNGGGNAGGGTNGNGQGTGDNANPNEDIDHDGIPDDEDDDRDGDGKPNNQDNDPDHPD